MFPLCALGFLSALGCQGPAPALCLSPLPGASPLLPSPAEATRERALSLLNPELFLFCPPSRVVSVCLGISSILPDQGQGPLLSGPSIQCCMICCYSVPLLACSDQSHALSAPREVRLCLMTEQVPIGGVEVLPEGSISKLDL